MYQQLRLAFSIALISFTATVSAQTACPTPVYGSVTNQTGSISGIPLNNLVDGYSDEQGAIFQHQVFATLTSTPNACLHYRGYQRVANEKWLILTQIAWNPDNVTAAPFGTGTYSIGGESVDTGGTHFTAQASYQLHNKSCGYTQKDATAGTITYTTVNATVVAGSYDLFFGTDHVTGTFTAPHCVLCAPRPSKSTCIR